MHMLVKMITVVKVTVKSNRFVKYIVGLMRIANNKNGRAYQKALILMKSGHDESR